MWVQPYIIQIDRYLGGGFSTVNKAEQEMSEQQSIADSLQLLS